MNIIPEAGLLISGHSHTHMHTLPTVKIWTRTRQSLISMGEQFNTVLNKCWGNKVPSSLHKHTHRNMHTFRCAHAPFMGDSMWCMALGNHSPESVALKEPHCSWDRGWAGFWDTETPYQACSGVTCHMTDRVTAFYRFEQKSQKKRGAAVLHPVMSMSQSHSCHVADVTWFSKLKLQFQVLKH